MKVVKVNENKFRRANLLDWLGENYLEIGCALLVVSIILVGLLIIR